MSTMIWSIAWKNVWRNKTRSLIVITAVTLGIISGVLLVGIMKGWVEQRLNDAIYNEVSHIKIHNQEFLDNEEILSTIRGKDMIFEALDAMPEIAGWVPRTKITAMAATSMANTGLFLFGVDPEKEMQVTEIYKKIVPEGGEYLNSTTGGTILISDKTAEMLKLKHYIVTGELLSGFERKNISAGVLSKLSALEGERYRSPKDFKNALESTLSKKELDRYGRMITDSALDYRLRSRIQVTITAPDGTPVSGIFRVCGIYKTTNTGFDQGTAFVNKHDLAALYGPGEVLIHEIAILTKDIKQLEEVEEKVKAVSAGNAVSTWKDMAPDAAMMNDFMIVYYFMFIGIIMLALAFGIINTMLMAILERTRELGMLMAIGMDRRKVFSMIMLETIFLTGVGAIAGMFAGWGLVTLLARTGIHFKGWGEGFEAIGFAAVVYPFITTDFFIFVIITVMATAVLASIWPARKALRLNPVETLRTE